MKPVKQQTEQPPKKTYNTPSLQLYGSLGELTKAGSGTKQEHFPDQGSTKKRP